MRQREVHERDKGKERSLSLLHLCDYFKLLVLSCSKLFMCEFPNLYQGKRKKSPFMFVTFARYIVENVGDDFYPKHISLRLETRWSNSWIKFLLNQSMEPKNTVHLFCILLLFFQQHKFSNMSLMTIKRWHWYKLSEYILCLYLIHLFNFNIT